MPKQSSDHLDKVPPILVKPLVAAVIGLNEAIVIQQVTYWLQKSKHYREGRRWIYNTYEEWEEQFPFWSVSTIGRIFRKLEAEGFIISRQFNADKYDRTKWYTIDYDALDLALEKSGMFDDAKLTPSEDAKMERSSYTETTNKTTSSEDDENDEDEAFNIFEMYHHVCGRMVASAYQAEKLQQLEEDYPSQWITDAFKKAINAGARNPIDYAESCLKDWKLKGHPSKQNNTRPDGNEPPPQYKRILT